VGGGLRGIGRQRSVEVGAGSACAESRRATSTFVRLIGVGCCTLVRIAYGQNEQSTSCSHVYNCRE